MPLFRRKREIVWDAPAQPEPQTISATWTIRYEGDQHRERDHEWPAKRPAHPGAWVVPDGAVMLKSGSSRQVKGESFHQEVLEWICGGRCEDGFDVDCYAVLVREPTNEHDPNAVRVEVAGQLVGHLPKEDARAWSEFLSTIDRPAVARANVRGGWDRGSTDRGSFGIFLHVELPLALAPRTKFVTWEPCPTGRPVLRYRGPGRKAPDRWVWNGSGIVDDPLPE